ncbi:serine/threonine-protein kinase [Kitasatospora sp. SUK 42]|uniref:serine/threonine-protein kinase n=1 Tax=Kitasatospora sp. SUK 42 TaxID=1588882 RepID=UPI0018C97928|nr:serine/threonine-protein kinase [Kitasatospora sp. SUK 42]MBV2153363.1 protein kinase [Kitasatospora sp. SUK 42]
MRPTDPTTVGGRYRLLARLGSGGMGVVYLGRSPGGRLVAVKCVHWDLATDPRFRLRFTQELEAARRVGGFHTAQVVDADPDGDPPWLVTAYIPGPSLEAAVATHGPLPEPVLRVLGAGLAEALEAIHAVGLVHRDLKPSNVLLSDDGPRVIDFGIARALDGASITRTQTVIGTPGYMAPEQIAGEPVGPACDLFSLGRVLCHASGSDPYGGGNPQVLLYRIMHTEPDLTGVPEALRPIVADCLARRPEDRPTPAQLLARLGPPAYDGPTGSWLPEGLRAAPAVPEAPLVAPAGPVPAGPVAVGPVPAGPVAVGPVPVGPVSFGPVADGRVPATRVPTVLAGDPYGAGGWARTEPSEAAEARRRKARRLWVLVPSLLALVAVAVLVPLYLTRDRGASGLDNGGFVVAKDDGSPPDCVTGGTSGGVGGANPSQGPPATVPDGTPHAPGLLTPGDRDTLTLGRSLVLSWDKTGPVTRVFTKLRNDPWKASGWLVSANCTFKPTEAGVYQWAVVSSNTSTGGVASGWSTVRYLNVQPDGVTANPVKPAPSAPLLVAPADQAVVRAGQPVTLSWASSGTNSTVSVLPPGSRDWDLLPWQSGLSTTYTPTAPGTYIWVVYTSGPGNCTGGPVAGSDCVSGASEQRYLIVR